MTSLEADPAHRIELWIEEGRLWADTELSKAMEGISGAPEPLVSAMKHALLGGGKRLRPSLVKLFCSVAGGGVDDARAPAMAIEMVHTYSLVHDDLPCMDDDDMRRGLPTVHKEWDEATAVLAGDGLLTEAFGQLSSHPRAGELVAILAESAGASGMVGGQVLDLTVVLSSLPETDRRSAVEGVHRAKTASLFAAACELGWVAGRGDPKIQASARIFGIALGLLFQATDDLIDVTGTVDGLGKTPGKDAALMRPSLVAALDMQGAQQCAEEYAASAKDAARELGLSRGHPAFELVDLLLSRTH